MITEIKHIQYIFQGFISSHTTANSTIIVVAANYDDNKTIKYELLLIIAHKLVVHKVFNIIVDADGNNFIRTRYTEADIKDAIGIHVEEYNAVRWKFKHLEKKKKNSITVVYLGQSYQKKQYERRDILLDLISYLHNYNEVYHCHVKCLPSKLNSLNH